MHTNQFSAWVTIEGVEAKEYGLETSEDGKTLTCWIPSELGKKFAVNWKNTSFFGDTGGYLVMDGNACGGVVLYKTSVATATKDGITQGNTTRPFVFSSLTLTDDDAFLGGATNSHHNLGLIQLDIRAIQVTGPSIPQAGVPLPLSDLKVHERSKKAVTQQIKLGDSQKLARPESSVAVRTLGAPLVTFAFKYRPLDILRASGIAPSPPPLKRKASVEVERDATPVDDDLADAEEARQLREKLNALEAKRAKKNGNKARVKEEENIPPTRPNKKVKLEGRLPFIPGEIIDLTW